MNLSINNSNINNQNTINTKNNDVNHINEVETNFNDLMSNEIEVPTESNAFTEYEVSIIDNLAINTASNTDEMSTEDYMMARSISFSTRPVEGMVFDEKYGYVTPEYLEQLQEWSKRSEEYFANNPDIELPPLSDIDGLNTDKTDADYTGTTYEELTDKQKDELRAILGDDTASSITSMEKLNDYLAKLVDFGVIKRSDAGVMNGSIITVNIDDNGNVIQDASQLNVNRDNWNGSVVEWFCRLEEDLVNKLGMFSADKNYSNATESAKNELTRIREMQELIGKLFAEENN